MDKVRGYVSTVISYIVLTAYALLSLYPFLWMVSSALKSNREVLSSQSLIPQELHFDVIVNTWNQLNFFKYFTNSVIISVLAVGGIVLVYSMAGFGFAKTRFVGRNLLFIAFLGVMFVPGVTVLVPLVQLLRALGMIGRDATQVATYTGLIMPIINGAGPLSIFLFRNYFSTLPGELHDAARVDGSSNWGIYFRIFLPLATPVIATVGILNFIGTWNAYIWPSIVLNNPDWFTLPLKLKDLDLQIVVQWNVRMAGSLITVIPVILVFLFLQRYYIRGLTAGAIRG
ncbi:MAG: carbohydrate ABC transporter permease [Chloroflexi bacterium]|nr:carbohydrate ABC transporter permease [Chloroflexota bacterium]